MFGDILRELRKQKHLSQEELGKKIGTTKQTISRYESGRTPDIETIMQLAEALEVPFSTLVQGYDWSSAVLWEDATDRAAVEGMVVKRKVPMPENKVRLHEIVDRLTPEQADTLLAMMKGLVEKP